MSLQVEKDSLYFKGVGGAEKKTYELTMKFLKEVREEYKCCLLEIKSKDKHWTFILKVDTETVKFKAKGQGIDVAIEKVQSNFESLYLTFISGIWNFRRLGWGGTLLGTPSPGQNQGTLAQGCSFIQLSLKTKCSSNSNYSMLPWKYLISIHF